MDVHVAQLSPGCVPVISEITSAEPKGWKCCQGLAVRGPLEVFKLTLSQVGTALSVTSNRRQWVLQHGCAFVSVPGPAGCRQAERCSSRWAVKLSCTLFAYEEWMKISMQIRSALYVWRKASWQSCLLKKIKGGVGVNAVFSQIRSELGEGAPEKGMVQCRRRAFCLRDWNSKFILDDLCVKLESNRLTSAHCSLGAWLPLAAVGLGVWLCSWGLLESSNEWWKRNFLTALFMLIWELSKKITLKWMWAISLISGSCSYSNYCL